MLKKKNFGAKVFRDGLRIDKLILLAKSGKYSVSELATIFKCGKTTLFGIFEKYHISIPNKGRFLKIYHCNDQFFEKLNRVSAYWLGFVAADGALSGKDNGLTIGLMEADVDHLRKFLECIDSDAKISFVKSNNSVHVGIYSKEIFDSLFKLGIKPNKSLRMGNVYIPQHFCNHFVRGLFDGDGSLSGKKVTHVQWQIAGYMPLLKQVQNILVDKCKVNQIKIYHLKKESRAFRLQYTGSQIFKILDFMYKDSSDLIRLDRKYQKYLKFKKCFTKQ